MRGLPLLLTWCLCIAPLAGCRAVPPLPRIAAVPAFELQDQQARTTTQEALRGKVWIANFMFTSCPDVCPLLTAKMGHVRTKLRDERASVRFVSFSVDPVTDTPEVLARYATEQGALSYSDLAEPELPAIVKSI